jgi:DNA-directed RNA polymerase subunit RPC12/RpoP
VIALSNCDGCGTPIGHATAIEGRYESDKLDRDSYYFGDSECKHIFEEEHDVEERIVCPECGELVLRDEAEQVTVVVSGIRCSQEVCSNCAEEGDSQS